MTQSDTTIAGTIRTQLRALNISANDVATFLDLTVEEAGDFIEGRTPWPATDAYRVATHLGIDPSQVFADA